MIFKLIARFFLKKVERFSLRSFFVAVNRFFALLVTDKKANCSWSFFLQRAKEQLPLSRSLVKEQERIALGCSSWLAKKSKSEKANERILTPVCNILIFGGGK